MELLAHMLAVLLLVSVTTAARIQRQAAPAPLNLKPTGRAVEKSCTYGNETYARQGICVDDTYCSPEHYILEGGNIDDSEVRSKSIGCRNDLYEWCCSKEVVVQPPEVIVPDSGCTASSGDLCPWCVALYTNPTPYTAPSGLFCMGSLIASNVILTASTCILQANNRTIKARIPGSPHPNRDYDVRFRKYHHAYKSDTHENDFGLLFLEKEVEWDKKWIGACLNFQPVTSGECYAMGFDHNDQIVSSMVSLTKGKCANGGGDAPEVVCASPFLGDYCYIVTGSPILCGRDKMLVSGIARSPCRKAQTALTGSLAFNRQWLRAELALVNLTETHYMINQ